MTRQLRAHSATFSPLDVGCFIAAILLAGSYAQVHAAEEVVEGTSGAGDGAIAVQYRCEGSHCGFEAILDDQLRDEVVDYEWVFSDGRTLVTETPDVTHTWSVAGSKSVKLSVYDRYCDLFVTEADFLILASTADVDEALTVDMVRLGQDGTRRVSEPLENATVSGGVYIFVEQLQSAKQIEFLLSDPFLDTRSLRVEKVAPYDLAGGAVDSARPFDTGILDDGLYSLEVAAIYNDGRSENVSVDFEVRNLMDEPLAGLPVDEDPMIPETPVESPSEPTVGAASPGPEDIVDQVAGTLLFSERSNRRRSESLEGAVVSGMIYAHLDGAETAESVRFYLDNPARSAAPLQVEGAAPWDAMGGSKKRARPLDTRRLDEGQHVLTAEIVDSGNTIVMHANFIVTN